jgi:predicted Zn-ribbon and HTH transcriptional regulator
MGSEKMRDFVAALELLIGWERAEDDFAELVELLAPAAAGASTDTTIEVLLAAQRKLGYNARLEALLARRWRCPQCKQFATIEKIGAPIGNPGGLPRCAVCQEEGIAPVETTPDLEAHDGGKSGLRPAS